MFRPIGCTCNRKYEGDPHAPGCLYASYAAAPIVITPRKVKCTCGNIDDRECKTDAHADYCDSKRKDVRLTGVLLRLVNGKWEAVP